MNQNPYSAPESMPDPAKEDAVSVEEPTVTVQISEKWVRRVNSPLFILISALTGVSISFAPLGLLYIGSTNQWTPLTMVSAVVCFLVVYLVPMFYMRLASEVIQQVHRKSPTCSL